MSNNNLLEIKNLKINFSLLNKDNIYAVNGINLNLKAGESLGVVGESGSGKSQFVLSLMGLLANNANVSGEIIFNGKNLLELSKEELNKIRGSEISMIFQDPMTSLNPYLNIETQMVESIEIRKKLSRKESKAKAVEMLNLVGMSEAERRLKEYPHQLSGGMRQRVMIAMALLSNPQLLIADEPTTALDVTLQAQILNLISGLQKRLNVSVIMITHDLGVVANICEKIVIFYGGQIVEYGTAVEIFKNPLHPYTKALLNSIPRLDHQSHEKLEVIEGSPKPNLKEPNLCVFLDRCPDKFDECSKKQPTLSKVNTRSVSCLKYHN